MSQILPRTKVVPWGRTLPAMESAAPSPFLEIPEAEWVCASGFYFAIFDRSWCRRHRAATFAVALDAACLLRLLDLC
jgi:hypothetical protein